MPESGPIKLPEHLDGYGIVLRRWRLSDAEALHQAVLESIGHLRPWMEWIAAEPQTIEQRRGLLARWDREWSQGGDCSYGIFAPGERVAGGCGLHHRRGPGVLEIGYWVHPAFLRQGIATRASRLLTDAAFTLPGIERVEIRHDRANVASRGVPAGLGFELIGQEPKSEPAPAATGVDCVWSMTRRRWRQD